MGVKPLLSAFNALYALVFVVLLLGSLTNMQWARDAGDILFLGANLALFLANWRYIRARNGSSHETQPSRLSKLANLWLDVKEAELQNRLERVSAWSRKGTQPAHLVARPSEPEERP